MALHCISSFQNDTKICLSQLNKRKNLSRLLYIKQHKHYFKSDTSIKSNFVFCYVSHSIT